jgi:hypothetical protein
LKDGSGRAKLRKTISRPGCERKLRLFLAGCIRRNWSLLRDNRSRDSVIVAERYADGDASRDELKVALDAAAIAYRVIRSTPDKASYCAAFPAWEIARFKLGFSFCIAVADVATMAPAAPAMASLPPLKYDEQVQSIEEVASLISFGTSSATHSVPSLLTLHGERPLSSPSHKASTRIVLSTVCRSWQMHFKTPVARMRTS